MYIKEENPANVKRLFRDILDYLAGGKYHYTDRLKEILGVVSEWQLCRLGMLESSHLKPYKGLIFLGPCGTGKTLILRAILQLQLEINARYIVDDEYQLGFKMLSETEIKNMYTHGLRMDEYTKSLYGLAIDDIGRVGSVKSYGTEYDPVSEMIDLQYNKFERSRSDGKHFQQTLYGTSNLGLTGEINLKYYVGSYIYDRIRQMCNIIEMGETFSYRQI